MIAWNVLAGGVGASDDAGQTLRERYIGANGLPSETRYLQARGVAPAPGTERYQWRVVFQAAYPSREGAGLGKANPIATDCHLVRTRSYRALRRALPVWDGRVYQADGELVLAAFSSTGEQVVGSVRDEEIVFAPAGSTAAPAPLRQYEDLEYNPFSGQLWRPGPGGAITEEQAFYLPFLLLDADGVVVRPTFEIVSRKDGRLELVANGEGGSVVLARSTSRTLARRPGYTPDSGSGCTLRTDEATTILEIEGELDPNALRADGSVLVLRRPLSMSAAAAKTPVIDGDFSDWRNVPGISDPRGDIPGYLEYTPDADLLEFKVRSDQSHLYFYTRVSGRHGNTAVGNRNDRYYYYVYIDADRNTTTGYPPTRDDNCYYGVTLGDDCESQFEFVGGRFVKTFFGFTGAATEKEVLTGRVRLAPSFYSRRDAQGNLRDRYKVEYVQTGDGLRITADYEEGTSDNIIIALSPDGSECEMRTALEGFLKDPLGAPIIRPGQRIDLAVGVEAAGRIHGNRKWGADSSVAIRGYLIGAQR